MFQDFSSLTQNTNLFVFSFTIFTSCISIPLYILTHDPSYYLMSNTHKPKTMSFTFNLSSFNIVVLSNPTLYELTTTNEGGVTFYIE